MPCRAPPSPQAIEAHLFLATSHNPGSAQVKALLDQFKAAMAALDPAVAQRGLVAQQAEQRMDRMEAHRQQAEQRMDRTDALLFMMAQNAGMGSRQEVERALAQQEQQASQARAQDAQAGLDAFKVYNNPLAQ
jgi:hypothetical protein